jgi:hypothetical protein
MGKGQKMPLIVKSGAWGNGLKVQKAFNEGDGDSYPQGNQ